MRPWEFYILADKSLKLLASEKQGIERFVASRFEAIPGNPKHVGVVSRNVMIF